LQTCGKLTRHGNAAGRHSATERVHLLFLMRIPKAGNTRVEGLQTNNLRGFGLEFPEKLNGLCYSGVIRLPLGLPMAIDFVLGRFGFVPLQRSQDSQFLTTSPNDFRLCFLIQIIEFRMLSTPAGTFLHGVFFCVKIGSVSVRRTGGTCPTTDP
jgi:hypothetical protein